MTRSRKSKYSNQPEKFGLVGPTPFESVFLKGRRTSETALLISQISFQFCVLCLCVTCVRTFHIPQIICIIVVLKVLKSGRLAINLSSQVGHLKSSSSKSSARNISTFQHGLFCLGTPGFVVIGSEGNVGGAAQPGWNYTTTGGMGPLCEKTHKRIAQLISDKRNERYSDVMSHLRTRLRFSLLKSILVALRGARGKRTEQSIEQSIGNVSFNLIPYFKTYEGY